MLNKKSDFAHRAWNLLRLALLWPRKCGLFRRRLAMELRLFPKFLKSLGRSANRGGIHYGERELSFDNTPIIHVKMHRPSSMRSWKPQIPCIKPQVEFDYDFESDDEDDDVMSYCNDGARKSFLMAGEEDGNGCEVYEETIPCDEGIDLKAEQFIAKFYEQMKLQRQISYLQYNEMINRGSS